MTQIELQPLQPRSFLRRELSDTKKARARRGSRHQFVTELLGKGIVRGDYPDNSLLPGDGELMRRLQVSRTALREALKTLSAKGLIQAKAKIGTRVLSREHWNLFDPDVLFWSVETDPDPAFLVSLSEMRLALEPEAAALAALRRNDSQIALLYAAVDQMMEARTSPTDFVDGDLRFHLAVADASGNPLMRSASAVIEAALAVTFTISSPLPDPNLHALTVARHKVIADAVRNGDADAARGAMRAVIREGMERVSRARSYKATGDETIADT